ncbi:ABC transporter substrate-binding protein [Photobacterium sp. Alg240-V54]|uniref:ABC transporter substrate-binding protein n=1 Tax=Photobacterium sp. Alg240-V54 TaxID=2305995 RepID=UPI0013D0EA7E|nr:ABC transporter substrate-binding protein [Photobacterium sp. Alg240-V54]
MQIFLVSKYARNSFKKLTKTVCYSVLFVPTLVIANVQPISGEVVIDSWRNDNAIWDQTIIPAFNKHYPNIKVTYRSPADPSTFNQQLNSDLAKGTAGDLIACRPFDGSLALFKQGHFSDITEMQGMENFPSFALGPWQTDSGAQTFCLPMASVIHGFFYNKTIFSDLNLQVPATTTEFKHVLEKIKASQRYVPIALGTKDKWEAATMGFQNIGPNYWQGEDGRLGLIQAQQRFTDTAYLNVYRELASWMPYLGNNYQQRSYANAIELFKTGKAAIYPTGSWDISTFANSVDFGVFAPPVVKKGDECYISDHTDLGMGLNTASEKNAAATVFLKWMTTAEFAELLTNSIPGFFSLSNHFFDVKHPIANEMMAWRNSCDSTIRNSAQILSRGTPDFELQLWQTSVEVLNGTMTPEEAVTMVQMGLNSWYQPQRDAKTLAEICQAITPIATSVQPSTSTDPRL